MYIDSKCICLCIKNTHRYTHTLKEIDRLTDYGIRYISTLT